MNQKYRFVLGLVLLLTLSAACASVGKETKKKPNIIFLFADDQSYETIHALGNKEIITPNLDKMVDSGVTFTNAYNMGAWHGAVCVASRTMLNTGRFVWRSKSLEPKLKNPDVTPQFWGNLMKDAGYDTYMAGKWHVQSDVEDCFQNVATERPGMPNDTPEGYNRPKHENDTT